MGLILKFGGCVENLGLEFGFVCRRVVLYVNCIRVAFNFNRILEFCKKFQKCSENFEVIFTCVWFCGCLNSFLS